jgi:hypothetical protein
VFRRLALAFLGARCRPGLLLYSAHDFRSLPRAGLVKQSAG